MLYGLLERQRDKESGTEVWRVYAECPSLEEARKLQAQRRQDPAEGGEERVVIMTKAEVDLFDRAAPHIVVTPDADGTATVVEDTASKTASLWSAHRDKRNALLAASDWTQAKDSPLSVAQQEQWESYRQALRDMTQQADPAAVVWPVEPPETVPD